MIKDNDYVSVYNDYDCKIYVDSSLNDGGYVLPPKIAEDEPYYVELLWKDVKKANSISSNFKVRKIRFAEDIEAEALKQLRIDIEKDKNAFTREEIKEMILHPSDYALKRIVAVDNIETIDSFLSTLIALKNTNSYFIAEKIELYIRARKEELEQKIKRSELEVDETENVVLGVVDEDIEDNAEEDVIEDKPKRTTKTKSTSKAKKATEK